MPFVVQKCFISPVSEFSVLPACGDFIYILYIINFLRGKKMSDDEAPQQTADNETKEEDGNDQQGDTKETPASLVSQVLCRVSFVDENNVRNLTSNYGLEGDVKVDHTVILEAVQKEAATQQTGTLTVDFKGGSYTFAYIAKPAVNQKEKGYILAIRPSSKCTTIEKLKEVLNAYDSLHLKYFSSCENPVATYNAGQVLQEFMSQNFEIVSETKVQKAEEQQ
ncbi:hypothetical protein RFI_16955 [Reticulomyxa filosa]|uniref:Uncharacterized protein n=1 Tax=Reticulomyxa filosa TaxID=46433 RepID=X6N2Z1_RETFI|nr:hypothetical protein RFI_16955 [Reticulomyxa filosa]|eukprot:ETO20263.1 hypothetical protein RFI_16955 [Reticulomyxa filosa]